MLSNHLNQARLLVTLDIYVIVCVLDADLLIPEYESELPIAAEPTPKSVHSLIEAPLAAAWHHVFVT